MRVDVSQCKGDDAAAFAAIGSVDGQAWYGLQLLYSIAGNLLFVLKDVFHAQRFEIIDGCAESNRFRDGGCACFKLPGQIVPG